MAETVDQESVVNINGQETTVDRIYRFRKKIWASKNLAKEVDEFLKSLEIELKPVVRKAEKLTEEEKEEQRQEEITEAEEGARIETVEIMSDLLLEVLTEQPDATLRSSLERFVELLKCRELNEVKGLVPSLVSSSNNSRATYT